MPEPSPFRARTAAPEQASAARTPASELPPIRIRYYRKMKPNRVYPVVVSWQNAGKGQPPRGGTPTVVVRLFMPGSQVVPGEHTLDLAQPKRQATFYVTPLALGPLRGARLEVVHEGKKVYEMALNSKVVRQRRTLVYLALAFLLPWMILTFFRYTPWTDTAYEPDAKDAKELQPAKGLLPGQRLEHHLNANSFPVPEFVEEHWPDVAKELRDGSEEARREIGSMYTVLCEEVRSKPIASWVAVGMLALTFVSWVVNRERRKRLVTKPIAL